MRQTGLTNQARNYVRTHYFETARKLGKSTVEVAVSDVHRALHWKQRHQIVCQALQYPDFHKDNEVVLLKREGPPTAKSGYSSTMRFTFSLGQRRQASASGAEAVMAEFDAVRGIARDVFASLGGGEAFLRRERAAWTDPEKDEERVA